VKGVVPKVVDDCVAVVDAATNASQSPHSRRCFEGGNIPSQAYFGLAEDIAQIIGLVGLRNELSLRLELLLLEP
jgi:hypothetical protein